jgi:hypothetical protein
MKVLGLYCKDVIILPGIAFCYSLSHPRPEIDRGVLDKFGVLVSTDFVVQVQSKRGNYDAHEYR